VPHPDDDVPGRGWNNSPARFFQKCYDRYLEHYEGYVRLAERLHQMRDEADATPDTLGKREWNDKLHRAYDAIERTTQRLDMLEEHYPELATDNDRISSRIGTARLHAGLTERFGRPH
jgi:DNA-directed RNA polymerase subunit K/omega